MLLVFPSAGPSAALAAPNDASPPPGFAMSNGPRVMLSTPLAHSTNSGLVLAIAVDPGCPAAGA
jgi:hypothetical protein